MNKRLSISVAVALTATGLLAGGGLAASTTTSSDANPVVTVAYNLAPSSFDPTASPTLGDAHIWGLTYETLLVQRPDGQFDPMLATDWAVSDDGLVYTFELRQGVTFHNGEPFEADDVVFTFERAKEVGSPYAQARVDNISAITAVDEHTVEIVLANPDSGFINNISNPLPAAAAILNREAATRFDPASAMIGTGPFIFESYAPGREVVFTAYDGYWNAEAVTVGGVVVRYIPEEAAQLAALRVGDVDLIFPSEETALILGNDPSVQLDRMTAANVLSLSINTLEAPLDNVDVRRAIALAIDPGEVVAIAQLGLGEPSGIVSPVYEWAVQRGEHENYPTSADPDAARELLAAAGYPDGIELEILSFSGFPTRERMVEIAAEQLGRAGIDVTITPVDVTTGVDRLLSANYQMIDNEVTFQANPFEYLRIRRERTGPVPPEIDALETTVRQATSPEELTAALHDLQVAQMDNVYPNISLAARSAWVAYDPARVGNVHLTFAADWRFLAAVELND